MIHFTGNKVCYPNFICHTKIEHPQNWAFHLHEHSNVLEVTYLFSGTIDVYCSGQRFTIGPDSLIITNPNVVHGIATSEGGDPIERAVIQFHHLKLDDLPIGFLICHTHTNNSDGNVTMAAIRQLARVFLQYYRPEYFYKQNTSVAEPSPAELYSLWSGPAYPNGIADDKLPPSISGELIQNTCACLLSLIEHMMQTQAVRTVDIPNDQVMIELMEYIEHHFSMKFTVDELAEKFYMSSSQLSRRFKKATGLTVNHFLNSRRLGEAERMLLFSDEKIPYIAKSSGFENYSYFYAAFRKVNGCTPLEYRKHRTYNYFRRIQNT